MLLFSQMTRVLDILQDYMEYRGTIDARDYKSTIDIYSHCTLSLKTVVPNPLCAGLMSDNIFTDRPLSPLVFYSFC